MKYLLACMACLILVCCIKESSNPPEVETYIEALKNNNMETIEVPDFNTDHISELLKFRNDKLKISNFPRNLLSSFYMEEVTLGMYVLWIIESIRMKEINAPAFYLFASLNPRIVRGSTGELVDQEVVFPEVSAAYFEWWNSRLSLEEKLQIKPLEELDLDWN